MVKLKPILRSILEGDSKNADVGFFLANTRLKVPSAPPYRYGDTSALCGQAQFEQIGGVDVLTNPALIDDIVKLVSVGEEITLREIYDQVTFPEAKPPSQFRPLE